MLWVDTNASSVSEMIYEFFLFGKDKGLKLSDEGARLIYAGIVGDTGRFLFPSTSDKTFAYAGELIHYHFSRTDIYEGMYNLKMNIVKLNGYILQNFSIEANGVASVRLTKELLAQFQAVRRCILAGKYIRKYSRNYRMGILYSRRRSNKSKTTLKGAYH